MERINKEKAASLLICASIIAFCLFTGGALWQYCIIPTAVLGVVYLITLKRANGISALMMIALVITAAISLNMTEGDFQRGLYESEKLIPFILSFVIGSSVTSEEGVSKGVIISSVLLSALGLIAYCGFFAGSEYIILSNSVLRLQSFFKYANTLACYLACGYLFTIHEYKKSGKKIYLISSALIIISLFLTFSKAMLPIFAVIGLLYLIFNREVICEFTSHMIFACLFFLIIRSSSENKTFFLSFILLCGYLALATTVTVLKNKKWAWRLWLSGAGVGAVGAVAIYFFKPSLLSTFKQRIMYMEDASKLIPNHLLFGNGAGSFSLLQNPIQRFQYDVKYVHNSFLQFLVENGLLFTLIFIAVILFAIYRFIKDKNYIYLSTTLIIVLHSSIDFDLSYGAVILLLGFLVAQPFRGTKPCPKLIRIIFVALLTLALALTFLYMTAEYFVRSSFETSVTEGDYEMALEKAQTLEKLCPRDSKLKISIASLISKTDNNREEILKKIDEARSLSPYDIDIFEAYIGYNMTNDNLKALCFDYINLRPKSEFTYEKAKGFVKRAYDLSIISYFERQKLIKEIDSFRKRQNVYDRNEYLDRIMKEVLNGNVTKTPEGNYLDNTHKYDFREYVSRFCIGSERWLRYS